MKTMSLIFALTSNCTGKMSQGLPAETAGQRLGDRRYLLVITVLLALSLSSLAQTTHTVNVGQGGTNFVDALSNTSTTTMNEGDTVHWVWQSSPHSTTSGTCSGPTTCTGDGRWDSTQHNMPFTYDVVFNFGGGTFPYYCLVHLGNMTGKVIVNPVVTTTADSGPGSLRQAILDLNADVDLTQITFNIPGGGVHTINLLSPLPAITGPAVLDGTTQPGWAPGNPVIELNGAGAGGVFGLSIQGGNTTVRGLVINRFAQGGILLMSNNNIVTGNFIGTDASGTAALGNGGDGVLIPSGNSGNRIGGTTVAERNVISGNGAFGIEITGSGTNGNLVEGNFIGTNAAGSSAIPNAQGGVRVAAGAGGTTIGVYVGGAGNLISGNAGNGIWISEGDSNTAAGNLIGTDVSGNTALGNGSNGILVSSGATNTYIGVVTNGRNIISGNVSDGVDIVNANTNFVAGNFIGTNAAGTAAVANGGNGMTINARGNFIGGIFASARNVISGNGNHGIVVSDSNVVKGNFIGTDASGSAALGNAGYGVVVMNGYSPIGAAQAGAGNVISGNALGGVLVSGAAAISSSVQGNLIGTDATGTSALGNGGNGISITGGASSSLIGGTFAGSRNVISGNSQDGVAILGSGTNFNQVQGNCIGTDVNCLAPLGNLRDGVRIDSGAANNRIGDSASNLIAFNAKGVVVTGDSATVGNAIEGNAIFSNRGLGIDLNDDGVTANDSSGHAGPNNFQNFPVLTSAISSGGISSTTNVTGTLNSKPYTSFHVELFGNPACDSSGHGQGLNLLGTQNVFTDGNGNATVNFSFSTSLIGSGFLSATATAITSNGGDTSEFSACLQPDFAITNVAGRTLRVRLGQPFTFVVAGFTDADTNGSASDFSTTTIDWGDGTAPSTATIVPLGGQNYNVIGTHTYTKVGGWTVTVNIHDSGGATATATSKARLWPKAFSF
jgi:titin